MTVQIKVEHVSVSSTLPRTTRSRWFLIRSSSIVMRHDGDYTESAEQCHRLFLFLFLAWLRLATSKSARFGADSPCLFVRKILYVINSSPTPALRKQ